MYCLDIKILKTINLIIFKVTNNGFSLKASGQHVLDPYLVAYFPLWSKCGEPCLGPAEMHPFLTIKILVKWFTLKSSSRLVYVIGITI